MKDFTNFSKSISESMNLQDAELRIMISELSNSGIDSGFYKFKMESDVKDRESVKFFNKAKAQQSDKLKEFNNLYGHKLIDQHKLMDLFLEFIELTEIVGILNAKANMYTYDEDMDKVYDTKIHKLYGQEKLRLLNLQEKLIKLFSK